jgi:hypothetical protein
MASDWSLTASVLEGSEMHLAASGVFTLYSYAAL